MACKKQEWSWPCIVRGRQDPMSTSDKLQQYHHPILGIQVMTPESLSPLPVPGEGGPLTEWDHGTSDEGSLGVEGDSPRTWHTFSIKVRMLFF